MHEALPYASVARLEKQRCLRPSARGTEKVPRTRSWHLGAKREKSSCNYLCPNVLNAYLYHIKLQAVYRQDSKRKFV